MTEKRKRRRGKREAMPDGLRQIATAAMDKHRDRFAPPKLTVEGRHDEWAFGCPYRPEDRDHWQALLFAAFGTRSVSTATVFLRQLAKLVGKGWSPEDHEWKPEPEELNMAIATVASMEVENEAQACLAAQFVACHLASMKLGAAIGGMTYPDERTVATLARSAKASAGVARTLAELQGKMKPRQVNQTIQVVYVDQRDQRSLDLSGRGASDFGGQAHASVGTGLATPCAALPSPCPDNGATVPSASGEGQARVPDARGLAWLWRTLRQG